MSVGTQNGDKSRVATQVTVADAVVVTHEDMDRAQDRSRVRAARMAHGLRGKAWLLIGPGILVMLGENDGPSMLSYAATGATYGLDSSYRLWC
jgi:hypothetical protein